MKAFFILSLTIIGWSQAVIPKNCYPAGQGQTCVPKSKVPDNEPFFTDDNDICHPADSSNPDSKAKTCYSGPDDWWGKWCYCEDACMGDNCKADKCLTKDQLKSNAAKEFFAGQEGPCIWKKEHKGSKCIVEDNGNDGIAYVSCNCHNPKCGCKQEDGVKIIGDEANNQNAGNTETTDDNNSGATSGGSLTPLKDVGCNKEADQAKYGKWGETHTMIKYCGAGLACNNKLYARQVTAKADEDAIVKIHNDLRRRVAKGQETKGYGGAQPAAADMMEMVWDEELATIAQRWADQCIFDHDKNTKTDTYTRGLGQNAFIRSESNSKTSGYNLKEAVQSWYNEVADFNPKNVKAGADEANNPGKQVGHYTQVVWAKSNKVGCGYTYYLADGWYKTLVICNYGLAGNDGTDMYTEGTAGSKCPTGTQNDDGLCKKA